MTLTTPPHVLVIEDEEDLRDLLRDHLERLGCRVSLADTGEQGLRMAAAEPPDLAIVDILLPGVDGREVARRLRADGRTSACKIAVSSVLDAHDLDTMGSDAILAKPFRRADVIELVESITAGRAQGDR